MFVWFAADSLLTLYDAKASYTPTPYSYTATTNATAGSVVESAATTLAGLTTVTGIKVVGGEYNINAGAYTALPGVAKNGDQIKVRLTSSGSPTTLTSATLTVGGVDGVFSVTTGTPPVTGDVPNQTGIVGTAFSLALSGYVTLTGGDAITSYAIASGALPDGLSLDTGTGAITGTPTTAGTFNVTVTASDKDGASNADAVQFVISSADTTPTAFTFTAQTGAALSTATTSDTLTVAGIDSAAGLSISAGGEYAVSTDGGTNWSAWSATTPATVSLGDKVKLRLTSSGSYNTLTGATLTVGGGERDV